MAANDLPPWLLWPGYQQAPPPYGTWNIAPAMGWSCPGCGSCWAPAVTRCLACPHPPVEPIPAAPAPDGAARTGPREWRDLIGDPPPPRAMHPCPKPLEGGLCGCDEGGEQ